MRGSPPPSFDGVVDCGGDAETAPGEAERVVGGLTAIESAVEALVEREVFEPVRRAKAARRGRGADVVAVEDVVLDVLFGALMLIRAASWLREGRRPPVGAFWASTGDAPGGERVELIVGNAS